MALRTGVASSKSPGKATYEQCSCGNFFMDDSLFCRKCGARRPEPEPSAKRAKVEPTLKRGADESPRRVAKVPKLDNLSDIADKIASVAGAMDTADGRSEPCRHMLHNMVPTSLGTPAKARSDDQKQGTQMIGKALRAIHKSLTDKVTKKEKELQAASDKARVLDGKKVAADRAAKAAKDDLDKKEEAVTRADKIVQEKSITRDKAKDLQDKALNDVDAAEQEKRAIDDLYNGHFLPLKKGATSGPAETNSHLDTLEGPLREWGCEDCMFASFKEASNTSPAQRGVHSQGTVEATDQLFSKPRRDAALKASKATDIANKAGNEAARAAKEADDASKQRDLANAKVPPSEKAHSDAQGAAAEADRLAQEAKRDVDSAQGEVDDAKKDADDFKTGPQSDYDALCKHEIPGYDSSSFPKASSPDDAKDPTSKKRVGACVDAINGDPKIDGKTRDMLSNMAPGALGPNKGERDDLQKEGVEMLKRGLNNNLDEVEDRVDDLVGGGYPADAALIAGKRAADRAKAAGKTPQEVEKAAVAAAKKAGGSPSTVAQAAADAASDAALEDGKPPSDVLKAPVDAAKGAGGSPEDIVNAVVDAVPKVAQKSGLSPAEAGKLAADAVKKAGGSPADQAKAAAKAAAKVAKANGDDPATVGKAAAKAAEAAGCSPVVASTLGGQAAHKAALDDGCTPEDAEKYAHDLCKDAGRTPDDIAKIVSDCKPAGEGKRVGDEVAKTLGAILPLDPARHAGKAAADTARKLGKSPAEQAKAAADAAKEAGGAPSDIARAAADAAADAAVAAGKSPSEVAKAAVDAFKNAGGAPEEVPNVAGNAAGKAARAQGKSPAEVGKAAGDACKAAGGTPEDAAKVAGRQAGKAAEEAGKSPEEVGSAAGNAARAAGGSPKDVTKATNLAKLADSLKNDPDKAPGIADTIVTNRTNDVDEAERKRKKACEVDCTAAKKALEDAKDDLNDAERARNDLEDAYKSHFLPIKNGVGSPEDHVAAVRAILDEYDCDPCLKESFGVSACHKPGERGEFCNKCVDGVEKFFATPRKLAADKISRAQAAFNKAQKEADYAAKVCDDCEIAVLRAKEELQAAENLRKKVIDLSGKKNEQSTIHDEE